jgi:hypothetical protein
MKKWIKIAGLLALMLPVALPADDFTYITNADNTITITKYIGPGGDVIIPSTTNGLPVTGIGWRAFYYTNLTSVIAPDSVTGIGEQAFYNCTSLTNVMIGNSVTSIGNGAFSDCSKLTSVTIPDSTTSIEHNAFQWCTSLINITIGNSVTNIGDSVFFYCTNLTTITIPDHVISIGIASFYNCTSLTTATIGNSVTNIGASEFQKCYSLKEVYFKGNAPSFGLSAFSGTTNATIYYLPKTTGWSSPFAGRPAVLWNPKIQSDAADFGVRSNQFGFNISATNDFIVAVEACTNLAEGVWVPVETNTLTGGSVQFSDPTWSNYPNRYYRVSMPQ